jgi:phosphoribosylanthranilate isomerase
VRVKICGLRRRSDVEAAVRAGADLVGFVFVPETPRAVDPDEVKWVRTITEAETVGVFRDAPLPFVIDTVHRLRLDRVQLHGREPDEWFAVLDAPVIRRVPVPESGVERARVERLLELGVMPLIDPGGGDGVPCDWHEIGRRLQGLEFALAGGLNPHNVAVAIAAAKTGMVDVSSGVERRPGVKDHDLMRRFLEEARSSELL